MLEISCSTLPITVREQTYINALNRNPRDRTGYPEYCNENDLNNAADRTSNEYTPHAIDAGSPPVSHRTRNRIDLGTAPPAYEDVEDLLAYYIVMGNRRWLSEDVNPPLKSTPSLNQLATQKYGGGTPKRNRLSLIQDKNATHHAFIPWTKSSIPVSADCVT